MMPIGTVCGNRVYHAHEQVIAGNRISYYLIKGYFHNPCKQEYYGALVRNEDNGESAGANLSEDMAVADYAVSALFRLMVTPVSFYEVIDSIYEMALNNAAHGERLIANEIKTELFGADSGACEPLTEVETILV
ncbi:MAG: DUF6514 family protein [Clostridiales bacterium]|jgi:hypothetical protein|nr:DUF6514 family protein [Clostridiales bacterium]